MAYFRCGGGLPTQQKTITATTSQQIVLPDEGNVLEKVTVNPQKHSTTATPTTRTAQYNLGEYHTVRYINTNSVPNNNTQTKTITTRGSSIDLGGATHNYRYVNTSSIPNDIHVYYIAAPIYSSSFPATTITFKAGDECCYGTLKNMCDDGKFLHYESGLIEYLDTLPANPYQQSNYLVIGFADTYPTPGELVDENFHFAFFALEMVDRGYGQAGFGFGNAFRGVSTFSSNNTIHFYDCFSSFSSHATLNNWTIPVVVGFSYDMPMYYNP